MNFVLQPWQLLVVILTGWLNRRQQAVMCPIGSLQILVGLRPADAQGNGGGERNLDKAAAG